MISQILLLFCLSATAAHAATTRADCNQLATCLPPFVGSYGLTMTTSLPSSTDFLSAFVQALVASQSTGNFADPVRAMCGPMLTLQKCLNDDTLTCTTLANLLPLITNQNQTEAIEYTAVLAEISGICDSSAFLPTLQCLPAAMGGGLDLAGECPSLATLFGGGSSIPDCGNLTVTVKCLTEKVLVQGLKCAAPVAISQCQILTDLVPKLGLPRCDFHCQSLNVGTTANPNQQTTPKTGTTSPNACGIVTSSKYFAAVSSSLILPIVYRILRST